MITCFHLKILNTCTCHISETIVAFSHIYREYLRVFNLLNELRGKRLNAQISENFILIL